MVICFNSCRLKIWTNTIEKVQGKGPDGEVILLPSCPLFPRSPSDKEYIYSPSTYKTLPSLGLMTKGQHLASAWELKPKSQPAFSYIIRKYLSNTRAILKTQSHKNPTQRNKAWRWKAGCPWIPAQCIWPCLWAPPITWAVKEVNPENSPIRGNTGAARYLKRRHNLPCSVWKPLLALLVYRTHPDSSIGKQGPSQLTFHLPFLMPLLRFSPWQL